MQFNVVPRTGGLAINKEKIKEKEGCDGIILTDVILTLPIVPGDEQSGGLAVWSNCQHVQMIMSLWGHP